MATIICSMKCKNKSRQPIRKWRSRDGEKLYGCKLPFISISRISDPDDYVVDVVGEENMAQCPHYDPVEPMENDDAEE